MDKTNNTNYQQSDATVPPPPQKSRRKKRILVAVVAVLLIGFAGYNFWIFQSLNRFPSINDYIGRKPKKVEVIRQQFYYVKDQKLHVFDFSDKRDSEESLKLEPDLLNSLGTNFSIQYSRDGQTRAYATGQNAGHDTELINTKIVVDKNGGQKEYIHSASETKFSDWVLEPSGQFIIYVLPHYKSDGRQDSFDLHRLNVSNGEDITVKTGVNGTLHAPYDGTVRLYSYNNGKLNELRYKISDNQYSEKNLSTPPCGTTSTVFCHQETYGGLSPDGNQLLWEEQTNELFTYHLIDTSSGATKKIYSAAKPTEQMRVSYWSPDNSKLAIEVGPFGNAAQKEVGRKNRFELLNLSTNQKNDGHVDPSPGIDSPQYNKHWVSLMGWSRDGKTLAFFNQNSIKFYDVESSKVLENQISYEGDINSVQAYGWFELKTTTEN